MIAILGKLPIRLGRYMFIEEYPGILPPELCEKIIALFEADPQRGPSVTSVNGQTSVHAIRSGTILPSDKSDGLMKLMDAITPGFRLTLSVYATKYPAVASLIQAEGLVCTAPVVERVDPGQGFGWHYDQTSHSWQRVLAGLLYLRTIKDGGHTEFKEQGRNIQPEAGKIALFPPYWTHLHRGVTPASEPKYVMSFFWIYARTQKMP
jgi:hypothetical protein